MRAGRVSGRIHRTQARRPISCSVGTNQAHFRPVFPSRRRKYFARSRHAAVSIVPILGFLAHRTGHHLRSLAYKPRATAIEMVSSSGFGSLSSCYLDPDHVFALVISRRPRDLFDYLDYIPGASMDLQCRLVSFAGMALLAPRLGGPSPLPDEDSWTLYWAKYAWAHAANSRLCAPQMVGNPFNFASDPGHYLHPLNSSSYSGRMLTVCKPGSNVLRHAAMLNQLSASSSRTPAATFPPQQANSNDVINFPIIRGGTLNQTSAFNSGIRASAFAPWQADSTLALAFAELSLGQPGSEQMPPQELMNNTVSPQELEQNNHGTRAVGVLSLHQPGPDQFATQQLMQNGEVLPTVDIKGKRPASEIVQQKLLVHVACLIAEDGTIVAAGLLITKATGQFICASCFQMRGTEPALFAAACCEGIKIAQAYQLNTIVLESHLFHLLSLPIGSHTPRPEMEELMELLDPPRCTIQGIPEESNGAARRLAIRGLQVGVPEIFFSIPPDWLVLT